LTGKTMNRSALLFRRLALLLLVLPLLAEPPTGCFAIR